MELTDVVNIILPIVFSLVGVALIVFVIELIKTLKAARTMVEGLDPTLKNVEELTASMKPTVAKLDPMMDRVQLTVDSVNLEMMRVDQILENVAEISSTASSATAAVDNITNAPLKAVSSVADRVRTAFTGRGASEESAQLAEQRVAVAQALEDYKAAEKKAPAPESKPALESESEPEPEPAPEPELEPAGDELKTYVKVAADGEEPVIDPKVIAESSFFDEGPDAK